MARYIEPSENICERPITALEDKVLALLEETEWIDQETSDAIMSLIDKAAIKHLSPDDNMAGYDDGVTMEEATGWALECLCHIPSVGECPYHGLVTD
jgi:hypothetical protein